MIEGEIVCVCVRARARACVCVCVCVNTYIAGYITVYRRVLPKASRGAKGVSGNHSAQAPGGARTKIVLDPPTSVLSAYFNKQTPENKQRTTRHSCSGQ
jgi:hypothetical protein